MNPELCTPWHAASFDRFLRERLPQILAERLPLAGYRVAPPVVEVSVTADGGVVSAAYNLPCPAAEGIFHTPRGPRVVPPIAAHDDLATAPVASVGEQLAAMVEARLGAAPAELPWDEALLRAWLPLDAWVAELLANAVPLDDRNPLARWTHLRRLRVATVGPDGPVLRPGHFGRVCPVETPEGDNLGRWLVVARGASIADGRLVPAGDDPVAQLGLGASWIPFLNHDDGNRALMGANMMRQWLPPDEPDPALVRTGLEPDDPAVWCGRNLLTAFCSLGVDTFEDAIVVSASAAARLGAGGPLEPGDKLSTRHGTKGVVSRIYPDEAMPKLPDGTPVELVYSHIGCQTRLNHGQLLEAVAGRVARAEGAPLLAPPFGGPGPDELRERLRAAGLPAGGMETLTLDGRELELPTTVGWLYWGKLYHRAAVAGGVNPGGHAGQRMGWLDHASLLDIGCRAIPAEWGGLAAAERDGAAELPARLAAGELEPLGPPTPWLAELTRRLAVAGIAAEVTERGLSFRMARPADGHELAEPVPHPWHRDELLTHLGPWRGDAWDGVLAADDRLRRLRADGAPEVLLAPARQALAEAVGWLFKRLVRREHLGTGDKVAFSGRAVVAPSGELRHDQVGLPPHLAWPLFGPLAQRRAGAAAVEARDAAALEELRQVMGERWVVITRAPAVMHSAHLAFRPVLTGDRVIRLHPRANMLLNADFDGDHVVVILPLTAATQREAPERLAPAAHLERDASLLDWLLPPMESLWGLAWLSLTEDGRRAIAERLGFAPPMNGHLTRADLREAAAQVWRREGVARLCDVLDALMHLGFAAARASGASIAPFLDEGLARPPQPADDDRAGWAAYLEALTACLTSFTDYRNPVLGPQLLATRSGARGSLRQLTMLLGGPLLPDGPARLVPMRHSQVEGLTPDEFRVRLLSARAGLVEWLRSWTATCLGVRDGAGPHGFGVLARAYHAEQPGVVFARAALIGEADPLTDPASRLFVGVRAE
ncbi:MAG: hypothetical protein HYU66_29615 [Armatimonadetes bacterium]|nr:hypothetical protein [Armatimonadota bacterium]